MAKIDWVDSAREDLYKYIEFIELDNPFAAEKLVNKVFDKLERLEAHPFSEHKPEEDIDKRFLEITVEPFRILYSYDENTDIVLIRIVIRSERNLVSFLAKNNAKF